MQSYITSKRRPPYIRETLALKLGKRLQHIATMIQSTDTPYEHIWDCCCDHGLLGASLLDKKAAPHIHFVDIVDTLMQSVEAKLRRFYPESAPELVSKRQASSTSKPLKDIAANSRHTIAPSLWHVHCIDVERLSLNQYSGRHLVIIAGVGGDLMLKMVIQLSEAFPNLAVDFLLCPVHHQHKLRTTLISLGMGLVSEKIISDNRRFYEIIYASKQSKIPLSNVGSQMWDFSLDEVNHYFKKTLNHYQKQPTTDAKKIISDYLALKPQSPA